MLRGRPEPAAQFVGKFQVCYPGRDNGPRHRSKVSRGCSAAIPFAVLRDFHAFGVMRA